MQFGYHRQTRAGQSAAAEYRLRHRRWYARIWKGLVLATLPATLWEVAVAVVWPAHRSFDLGAAVGVAITFPLVVSLAAPEHIDRWRRGAEGEKQTAKELRRLARRGWTVLHDLPDGRGGNRDHVAIAPSGKVFLLDTKAPGGTITVHHGVLRVRWLEDPDDGYERDLTSRMKAAAATLANELAPFLPSRTWVTPVVVIWGRWDGKPHMNRDVAWVHGKVLAERLEANGGQVDARQNAGILRAFERLDRSEAAPPRSRPSLARAGLLARWRGRDAATRQQST